MFCINDGDIFCLPKFQFHKVWGQLMKTGYQNSRFAHQVSLYLYTILLAGGLTIILQNLS
jgi:hypothetical protein